MRVSSRCLLVETKVSPTSRNATPPQCFCIEGNNGDCSKYRLGASCLLHDNVVQLHVYQRCRNKSKRLVQGCTEGLWITEVIPPRIQSQCQISVAASVHGKFLVLEACPCTVHVKECHCVQTVARRGFHSKNDKSRCRVERV